MLEKFKDKELLETGEMSSVLRMRAIMTFKEAYLLFNEDCMRIGKSVASQLQYMIVIILKEIAIHFKQQILQSLYLCRLLYFTRFHGNIQSFYS